MEYKTWTRKANALAAAERECARLPYDSAEVASMEASEVREGAWEVTIKVNGTPAEADEIQELLGNLCRVQALKPTPVPAEAWTAEMQSRPKINPADDARHEAESAHMGDEPKPARRSATGDRKLTCVAGKNPFSRGKSYDAWEWLAANPGATFAEAKAAGVRMRAISHSITMGWVRAE